MNALRALVRVVVVLGLVLAARSAHAVDIAYRSFSDSATMGPQAQEFAAKLTALSSTTLGGESSVRFLRLPGTPPVPSSFGGDIATAVAAGAAHGGFDAAYLSGGDINKAWGFLYNSGV